MTLQDSRYAELIHILLSSRQRAPCEHSCVNSFLHVFYYADYLQDTFTRLCKLDLVEGILLGIRIRLLIRLTTECGHASRILRPWSRWWLGVAKWRVLASKHFETIDRVLI